MGSGTLKRRQKKRGGVSFQSDACQALTKVLVFRGGCDMDWGMDELGGTQISSRDYFKEVCTVPLPLKLISNQTAWLKFSKIWVRIGVSCHNLTHPLTLQQDFFFLL